MIKVLAVVPCGQVFGLQIMTLRLFERLSRNVNSQFLVTRWTDEEFSRRLDKLAIPYTYSWLGMFSRKLDWANLKMTAHCLAKLPILYLDFTKLVRSYRPDVIYMANYHELILLWPVLTRLRIPIVYHVHNPLPAGSFYRRSFLFWAANVDHYIAVSNSVVSSVSNMGVDAKYLSLLHNGVDVSQLQHAERRSSVFSARYGWSNDTMIIGMTGQMTEPKGHRDFLEAARIVSEKYRKVHFVIGGRQEGPFFHQLQKYIGEHNLNEMVAFSGWQDDMRSFYEGIDVFVLPSRQDTEGLPLVVLEAMATGLPVVATRSGGAAEVVENGKTGILVERQNPDQLAEAIASFVSSGERRMRMGRSGRQRVEEFFDLSKQAARLEMILERVAKERNHTNDSVGRSSVV